MPIVTSMLWYGVGSSHEAPGQTGIAHFLEHMMFRGTSHRPGGEIDRVTTLNGGHNNAFTSLDHTAYYFSFSADRWPVALELEADRMQHLFLDPESLETERQVILEEIRMTRDNPWEPLRQAADAAAFPDHPYGRPVIGLAEDVAAISAGEMDAFYRSHYTAANAVLALAGDLDSQRTVELVSQTFATIPVALPPAAMTAPPVRRSGGILPELDRSGEVARILVALPAPAVGDPDLCVHHLLDNLLAGGKLSRLHRRLVETEQVASIVTTDLEETAYPYHFFVRAELNDNRHRLRAADLILGELDRLGRESVSTQELERARHQSLVQFLGDFETTFDRAFQMGLFELLGAGDPWRTYLAGLQAVGPDELKAAARRYADPAKAWVAIAGGRS